MNTLLRRLSAPMAMAALLAGCRSAEPQYVRNEGYVFGTTYHYTYAHSAGLGQAIALIELNIVRIIFFLFGFWRDINCL